MCRQSSDVKLPQQCALSHPKQATAQRVSGSRDQQTLSQDSPPPFAAMRKCLSREFHLTQYPPHSTRAFCERNLFRVRKSCIRSIGSGPCVGNGQRTRSPPPFAAMRKFLNCEFQQTHHAPHLINAFCERNSCRMRKDFVRSIGPRAFVGNVQRATTPCHDGTTTLCKEASTCYSALRAALPPRRNSRGRRLLHRAQHRYAEKLVSLARIFYGNELRHWIRRYKELTSKSGPQVSHCTLFTPHKPFDYDFVSVARNIDVKRFSLCRPTFPYPVTNIVFLPADISDHPTTQSKYKVGGAYQPVDFLST